jgi:hypothetical protein
MSPPMSVSKTTGILAACPAEEVLLETAQLSVTKHSAAIKKAARPLYFVGETNLPGFAFVERPVLFIMSPLELKPYVTKLFANIVLFWRLSTQFFEIERSLCNVAQQAGKEV